MKLLVLHYPIDASQKTIDFDEQKYMDVNNCSLLKKLINVFNNAIVITYEIGEKIEPLQPLVG